MSRTARLWRGVGSLTLGGALLSAGIVAQANDSPSVAQQLVNLGRQAASQGRADDAKSFYTNALKLDPANAEARAGVARTSNVRRVSFLQVQDVPPVTPAPPTPGV